MNQSVISMEDRKKESIITSFQPESGPTAICRVDNNERRFVFLPPAHNSTYSKENKYLNRLFTTTSNISISIYISISPTITIPFG